MLPTQGSIQFSGYSDLYDIVVPQDHELRKLNSICESFDFIYEELKDKYCLDNGRMAEDPRMLDELTAKLAGKKARIWKTRRQRSPVCRKNWRKQQTPSTIFILCISQPASRQKPRQKNTANTGQTISIRVIIF